MTRTLDGLESALAVLVLSSPPYYRAMLCAVTQDHSRSFEMTPLSKAYVSPFSTEAMSVSRTISEIFSVK